MIERVAKAIYESSSPLFLHPRPQPWNNPGSEHVRENFRRYARAAVEAMREPTEAMCHAGEGLGTISVDDSGPYSYWQAMICEALK